MSEIFILLLIGITAGFLSGGFGIGGGIIIIPALIFLLGFTQHQASGTSLAFMSAPIGLLAAINYYKAGHVNIKAAAFILAAFFIGSYLGSKIAINIPAKTLQRAFGFILLLSSLKFIFGK